jgi:hypothetical protein
MEPINANLAEIWDFASKYEQNRALHNATDASNLETIMQDQILGYGAALSPMSGDRAAQMV